MVFQQVDRHVSALRSAVVLQGIHTHLRSPKTGCLLASSGGAFPDLASVFLC